MPGSYKWPSYVMRNKVKLAKRNSQHNSLDYIAKSAFADETEFMQYVHLVPGAIYQGFIKAWEENRQKYPKARTEKGGQVTAWRSLDELAWSLSIDPLNLKLDLVRTCNDNCLDVSRIISAVAHPHVVLRNIKEALKPDGIKDRTLFFERRGELPRSGVNVNVDTRVTAIAGAKSESTPLPDFEESTVAASKIVREESSSQEENNEQA